MESKTNNKVSRGLFDINSMTGKMFFAITIIVFFLIAKKLEILTQSIFGIVSLAVITLPILLIRPIFTSKRFFVSLSVFSCLIVLLGFVFFKLWAYADDLDDFLFISIFFCTGILCWRDFFKLIGEESLLETNQQETNSLIACCLKMRRFEALFVLEFWMLLLGAFAYAVANMYGNGEMPTLYADFFFMLCWAIFSLFNLFGMLSITKKVKKSPLSIVSFAIITPIAIPLCIIYFLILLSISEKLAG